MVVKPAIAGATGADVDQQLTAKDCQAFVQNGESFTIRYIPRTAALAAGNLTASEIQTILTSGLSLGVVQHVSPDNWLPTAALGTEYGEFAGQYAAEIGLPPHTIIWMDLEMVSLSATADDVIAYANAWYAAVAEANYIPGLYVGWRMNLTSQQLYSNLSFRNYWKGYNADISVATRGYQLTQHPQQVLNGISFDPNTVQKDNLGDLPTFLFYS